MRFFDPRDQVASTGRVFYVNAATAATIAAYLVPDTPGLP
jgi:hypothetical protein